MQWLILKNLKYS